MVVKIIRRVLGIFLKKEEERVQSGEDQSQADNDREVFRKVFTQFLKTLIEVFYPVHLEWYEILGMVILGVLFGLGLGYITKHLVILR